MTQFVVDNSVVVKWFVPEVHAASAVRLLDESNDFLAPDLLGPELGNTLWRKVRHGDLPEASAIEILAAFGAIGVHIVPSGPLLPAALQLAVALDRTVYDCLYLALALGSNAVLVTADRKFYLAVVESGLASSIRWIGDMG